MAADMDIDMDLDIGLTDEETTAPQIDIMPEVEAAPNAAGPNYTSEDALQPTPQKIHLRGLDNLTTKDIKLYASEYFANHAPNVEWIDDNSANLVYETPEIARDALAAFASIEITDISQVPTLQNIPAKSFHLHPETNLEVRPAVLGDRKQAGARERSRFYLFNPEYDRAERRKRTGHRENKYRDRDDDGYRSQRYDDREHRKRQNGDKDSGFDDSLYDDDEAALAQRAARRESRRDSISSESDYRARDRRARARGGARKELFPDLGDRTNGRLRDRSASPVRGDDELGEGVQSRSAGRRRQGNAAAENRESAQMINAHLREAASTKELFPHMTGINHKRSDAFDAADATADLFSKQMPVPFKDGSSDQRPTAGSSSTSWRSDRPESELGRLNIRGVAKASAIHEFAIKGMAPAVKELFPSHGNDGKELFSEKLQGRGQRRQKAEDLFY